MAKTITAATTTASAASEIIPVAFVKMDFSSGFLYLHSSLGSLIFDGDTYTGVGALGSISIIEETATSEITEVQFELTGIDAANIAIALDENYQGRQIDMYIGFLDSDHALITDPMLVFGGRMDTMDVTLGIEGKITLTATSKLADWERPRIRRYTNEDQRIDYPSDRGFEFVNQMTEKQLIWGRNG